jgi:hypothetical protein
VGSRRTPTLYKLVFDDTTDFPGFEITLRSLTIREQKALGSEPRQDETEADIVARMCVLVSRQAVSWNREDEDGRPLPLTLESLEDEEPKLIVEVTNKWTEAMVGVPAPLESGSPSGEISAVESILTEIPSESLAS